MVVYPLSSLYSKALKKMRLYELNILAGRLSEGEKKWCYRSNSKRNIISDISSNVNDVELMRDLEDLWGAWVGDEEAEERFPPIIQVGHLTFGPLGVLESTTSRSRTEAEDTILLLEEVLSKNLMEIVRLLEKTVPEDVSSRIERNRRSWKSGLIQVILTFATDEIICSKVNELVRMSQVVVEIPDLFEELSYWGSWFSGWIVTKYGLIIRPGRWQGDPVEQLRDLLSSTLTEEQLELDLAGYKGSYDQRVLEYCLMHDPFKILTGQFGLSRLTAIAKKMGLNTGSSRDPRELATLILLKLGFNIPPAAEGLETHRKRIQRYEHDFSERPGSDYRASVMARIFVVMERILQDLTNFYVGFLWQDEFEERYLHVGARALNEILEDKLLDSKTRADRLGFGSYISILRRLTSIVKKDPELKRKMHTAFDRSDVLTDKILSVLDKISPYRSYFTHAKEYPGDRICMEIFELSKELVENLDKAKVYPIPLRITRKVSDAYGRHYSNAIGEEGRHWRIYTSKELNPEKMYLMYSTTDPLAIHPVLVQKV